MRSILLTLKSKFLLETSITKLSLSNFLLFISHQQLLITWSGIEFQQKEITIFNNRYFIDFLIVFLLWRIIYVFVIFRSTSEIGNFTLFRFVINANCWKYSNRNWHFDWQMWLTFSNSKLYYPEEKVLLSIQRRCIEIIFFFWIW